MGLQRHFTVTEPIESLVCQVDSGWEKVQADCARRRMQEYQLDRGSIPRGSTTTTMNGEETCFFIGEAEEIVRNTKCC